MPHWSLDNIYISIDSAEFDNDLKKLERLSFSLEKEGSLELYDEASAIAINLDAYVSALLSVDSSNERYLKALSRVEDALVVFHKAEDSFIRALGESEVSADESLFVREARITSGHLMSREEEALAMELARSGEDAWSRLQESLSASAGDGKKSLTELRSVAFSADRNVRKDAYEREIKVLETHSVSFASALSGVKGSVLTLERRRGWRKPIDRSLFSSRITEKTLDALIHAIESSLPLFRDYLKLKARILGIDDFSFYDLFAPVGKSSKYSFEDARDIVISSYASFDKTMADFASYAFEHSWIDAEPHPGKAGGAYDVYFPCAKESRVFCNFDGSYDSVLTLAHELGHAYHDSILRNEPVSRATYPMTLAESASLFGELLVTDALLSSASDREEKLFITEQFMSSSAQTIVDIYSRYLFEKNYFEKRREGDVSAAECSSLMLGAQDSAYGDALKEKHQYMWAVKSHYYDAGFSFYNYPYAFGLLFSLSLYARKDEPGFASLYRDVLYRTGSMDVKSLLSSIGIDSESREFWMSGVDIIARYKEMMESCV